MKKTKREKFDAARKDAFLDLLAKGIKRGSACKKVGISRMTFNRHYNKNKAFADAVLQADMDANELIEQAMFNSALKGNVTAQQVWLYNRDPDHWRDRRNIELTGKNGGPMQVQTWTDLMALAEEADKSNAAKGSQKD